MNNILLMTACIKPYDNIPVLKISNADERLKHYKEAIVKYINNSNFDTIVMVDNSDFVLENEYEYKNIAKKNRKEFIYLTFKGNEEKAKLKGKSYGEGEIIEYALNNCSYFKKNPYFFKVSGRYFIKNNRAILKRIDKNNNYFDPWNYKRLYMGIDSVFFGCKTKDYLLFFAGEHEYADDDNGYGFERILYDCIKQKNVPFKFFPISPQYDVPVQASTGYVPSYKWYKEVYKKIRLIALNLKYGK